MPTYRAQVTIPMVSGIAADAVTNTWYFQGADTGGSLGPAIGDQLQAFYQAIDGAIFSNDVGGPAVLKCYDLADAEPRQVKHQEVFTILDSGSDALPHECAVVLSFAATVPSGENPARRRGRVFLGPLGKTVADPSSGTVRVEPGAMTSIVTAAEALQDAGDNVCQWVIYSPTHHEGRGITPKGAPATPPHDLDDSVFNVTRGWVDNAFDTIRSRGEKASSRVSWT